MTAAEVLETLDQLGVTVWVHEGNIRLKPSANVTADVRADIRKNKVDILSSLSRRTELVDLPFPIGYGGLPTEEVARAEANNDRLGIADPVERRLNVLSWMRCYYRELGNVEMDQEMRDSYHELRHADPAIQQLCGLCEYAGL